MNNSERWGRCSLQNADKATSTIFWGLCLGQGEKWRSVIQLLVKQEESKCSWVSAWSQVLWLAFYRNSLIIRNNAICNNMDGPGDDRTKWSKSEKDKNYISHICGLKKMIQLNLSTEQKQTHRPRKQTYFPRGKLGLHVHTAIFRMDSQPRLIV